MNSNRLAEIRARSFRGVWRSDDISYLLDCIEELENRVDRLRVHVTDTLTINAVAIARRNKSEDRINILEAEIRLVLIGAKQYCIDLKAAVTRAKAAEVYAEKLQAELWNMVNRARDGHFHSGGALDTDPDIASALQVLWEPIKK